MENMKGKYVVATVDAILCTALAASFLHHYHSWVIAGLLFAAGYVRVVSDLK